MRAVYHLYVVRVPFGRREQLQASLKEAGIDTGIHYPIALPYLKAYQPPRSHRAGLPGGAEGFAGDPVAADVPGVDWRSNGAGCRSHARICGALKSQPISPETVRNESLIGALPIDIIHTITITRRCSPSW